MTITNIFNIIQYLALVYFGFSAGYILLFAIASYFYKYSEDKEDVNLSRFLILIPAYKEDAIILNTALDALKQDYPPELYDVYVIADSLKPETIELMRENEIKCIEVSFQQSTKARSINKALHVIVGDYDGIIILDADNIMEDDFINNINKSLANGNKAIQAHRMAKNLDSNFAILDALSEEINNTIFRKGHIGMGLSSALIGSGMAFDFQVYKSIMEDIDTYADEDKELELKLFINRNKIAYLNHAYVYDEKVSNSEIFVKQRSRWISSQIYYARTFLIRSIHDLFVYSNIDLFNKVLQFLLVPRIMLLGLTTIFTVLSFFFNSSFFFYSWLITLLVCVAALILSVPLRFYNRHTLNALLSLPYGFLMMALAIVKIKLGSKRLSPTPHSTSSNTINKKKESKKILL